MEKFGIPVALGSALSENPVARQVFANLDASRRQAVIDATRNIKSKKEMQNYVNSLIRTSCAQSAIDKPSDL